MSRFDRVFIVVSRIVVLAIVIYAVKSGPRADRTNHVMQGVEIPVITEAKKSLPVAAIAISHDFIWKVITLLQEKYVRPEQLNESELLNEALEGAREYVRNHGGEAAHSKVSSREEFFKEFEQLKTAAANDELILTAVDRMLRSLDSSHTRLVASPRSAYVWAQQLVRGEKILLDTSLGLQLHKFDEGFIGVERVLFGGAAYHAGMQRFDRIVSINNWSIDTEPELAFRSLMNGGVTTFVIQRKGVEKTLTIKDGEQYNTPDVECQRRYVGNHAVRYIVVNHFGYKMVREIIRGTDPMDDGCIIDLRGCPGGYIDCLTQILTLFLKNNETFMTTTGHERTRKHRAAQIINGPFVFIVDARTWSAAEVFAQVMKERLKDHVVIVGEHTAGAVELSNLEGLGNGIGISVAREALRTIAGVELEGIGVSPDVFIPFDVAAAREGRDNQLEAAKECLVQLIEEGK